MGMAEGLVVQSVIVIAGMRPMRAWVIMRVWRVRSVSERMAQIQTNATAMPPPAMGMTLISSVDLFVVLVWILP